jgi:hypothetical protein
MNKMVDSSLSTLLSKAIQQEMKLNIGFLSWEIECVFNFTKYDVSD